MFLWAIVPYFMMNIAAAVTRLLIVGLVAWVAFAPSGRSFAQQPATVDVTQVIVDAYPEVTAVVTVRDGFGTPLGGVPAEAFSAAEDGRPAPVLGVQAAVDAGVGLAVVMVMDTSGSMAGAPLASTQEAAVRFIDSLLPNDQAAIISFAGQVSGATPLTADKQALAAALNSLRAEGATALYDAVVAGIRTAASTPLPRKVVVLLTDGQEFEQSSSATLEQSLADASNAGIPVFTIGIGDDVNAAYLQDVALRSGGQFLAAPAPADIPAVYDGIGRLLRAQYLLRLRLSAPADGGESELSITVTDRGATATGSSRFARPGVAPTPASTSLPTPTPSPPSPSAAEGDGGSPLLLLAMVVAPVVALAGGGLLTLRFLRRRRHSEETGPTAASERYRPPPPPFHSGPETPAARLVVVEGPDAGASVDLGETAVTIGCDADAALRLDRAGGLVGGRHARVWLREGRYMLHHLDRNRSTQVGGRQVEWAVLESGDEIEIGPHRIRFEGDVPL